jgi:hypothetical protein
MNTVYVDEALGLSCMHGFRWFKRFKEGCEDLEDELRVGHPSTA